jgi:hypothetical protein
MSYASGVLSGLDSNNSREPPMASYKCNTKDCPGRLKFDDDAAAGGAAKPPEPGYSFRVVILDKTPQQCPRCGQSYYRYELEPA